MTEFKTGQTSEGGRSHGDVLEACKGAAPNRTGGRERGHSGLLSPSSNSAFLRTRTCKLLVRRSCCFRR